MSSRFVEVILVFSFHFSFLVIVFDQSLGLSAVCHSVRSGVFLSANLKTPCRIKGSQGVPVFVLQTEINSFSLFIVIQSHVPCISFIDKASLPCLTTIKHCIKFDMVSWCWDNEDGSGSGKSKKKKPNEVNEKPEQKPKVLVLIDDVRTE